MPENEIRVPLPPEMDVFRADIEFFVGLMIRKLYVNRHKGFTKDLNVGNMLEHCKAEIRELEKAIDEKGQFEAVTEAADVANFGFLIAMAVMHMPRPDFEKMAVDITRRRIEGLGNG